MPLFHSEKLEDCKQGLECMAQLLEQARSREDGGTNQAQYLKLFEYWGRQLMEILTEFGRFPDRNKILNRANTEAE
jgi:uncharacterized protein (DUF924 family)